MKNKILWFLLISVLLVFSCNNNDDVFEYTGIVEGISVKVPALTGGKILQMVIKEGQSIKVGQLIAVVDTMELIYTKDQIAASLEELLVQTEIAKTNLSRTNNDYVYAKEKYDRMNKLYKSSSIPKQSLDDIKNKLESVESTLVLARQNQNSIEAKRKQLNAQLKLIEKKIKDAKIYAPLSGFVTSKYFETGEAVMQLNPVVEIININVMETKIYVSETRLPKINLGQEVTIKIDGIDEDMSGEIEWISPESEFTPKTILTPETRTSLVYAIKVTIDNPNAILKHGMPVVIQMKNED